MTGKQLALALGFIVLVATILKISEAATGPGNWECRDGEWTRQGKTSGEKPIATCAPLERTENERSSEEPLSTEEEVVILTSPSPSQIQTREIVIRGEAKDDWFGDGSFYATLLDEAGGAITMVSVREDGSVREGVRAFAGHIALPAEEAVPKEVVLRLDPAGNKEYISVFIPIEIR